MQFVPSLLLLFDFKLLTLNFQKTNYIPFTNNKSTAPPFNFITIHNEGKEYRIPAVDKIKYLGIVIDKYLRWDLQVKYVAEKLRFLLYKFRLLRNILNDRELRIVYYSLVQSHLQYGIIGWGGAAKSHLTSLEITQKKILKILLQKNVLYPTEQLFIDSQLLDLRQLYFVTVNIAQHKNKSILNSFTHAYQTRQRSTFHIPPRIHKTIGQRSFRFLGPKLYNSLPQDLKTQHMSVYSFKKKLRMYVLNRPRKEIHELIG